MVTDTPFYTFDPSTYVQPLLKKYDITGLDTSSPGVIANNCIRVNLGNTFTGEDHGWGHLYGPPGLFSVPIAQPINNTLGPGGTCTGTEAIGFVRNNEDIILGIRDNLNQSKSGLSPSSIGSVALYAAGYSGNNNFQLTADGNQTSNCQTFNLVSGAKEINLGSLSPSYQVAVSQLVDENFTTIQNASATANIALAGLVNGAFSTPRPATTADLVSIISILTTLLNAIDTPFPTVKSTYVNLAG